MRVLLVTSWNTPNGCGIEEHSRYLSEAVRAADPGIDILPLSEALDPEWLKKSALPIPDVLWLNYHAALHSRWTPYVMQHYRSFFKVPIGVTYHDTGVPNSDQCKAVIDAADVAVVHEPFDDLPPEKTLYWRMGVPAAPSAPFAFSRREETRLAGAFAVKAYHQQPMLGTIGFPFPWKNQVEAARVAASVGWGFCCICPTASPEYVAELRAANPDSYIRTDFVPAEEAIRILAACDATAFTYVCANTGQSAAILQGIAARKPVIAFHTCRQFRSLWEGVNVGDNAFLPADTIGAQVWENGLTNFRAIRWCATFDDVARTLQRIEPNSCDPGIVALAHRESWTEVGKKYAALYRSLVS